MGRQGISLRGHEEKESNVYQLLKMLSTDDPKLKQWMENRPSYILHEIQNEILKITSHQITNNIVDEIKKAQYFSIILDGTQDVSKIDQHCLCIRYLDDDLVAHEEFLGLNIKWKQLLVKIFQT